MFWSSPHTSGARRTRRRVARFQAAVALCSNLPCSDVRLVAIGEKGKADVGAQTCNGYRCGWRPWGNPCLASKCRGLRLALRIQEDLYHLGAPDGVLGSLRYSTQVADEMCSALSVGDPLVHVVRGPPVVDYDTHVVAEHADVL